MKSPLRNERGAVLVIELIVLAVVIAVAGFAIFRYLEHKKAVNPAATPVARTPAPTPDPYAGWKTFTSKYDKLSFKYPADWKLTDKSGTGDTDASGRPLHSPGQDWLELVSNSSLKISVRTGVTTYDFGGPNVKSIASVPVSMLGGKYYLNFIGSSS
jgi:hypothetical protein